MMRRISLVIIIGFFSGLAGAYTLHWLMKKKPSLFAVNIQTHPNALPIASNYPHKTINGSNVLAHTQKDADTDFSTAAQKALPSVVYINSIVESRPSYSYWDLLFNQQAQQRVSSGSGVIYHANGYIVTNKHVIEAAEIIEVTYNKRVYQAKLVGFDSSTDLAVLKINANKLPAITIGNSNRLMIGEWVAAVGNPFSLSSTITAGIVSAKGRRINVVEDKFPIESFIQTDAAINPGNSGGALVNIRGELVGINTAILSRTGSYTGYSFAVPINIVNKAVEDIITYGIVQKPFFGAKLTEYDYVNAQKYNISTDIEYFTGALIVEVKEGGSADHASLQAGDIIVQIDSVTIDNKSDFEEALSQKSPGDRIAVVYKRKQKQHRVIVILVNESGNTDLVKRQLYNDAVLGATLESTAYGVKVVTLQRKGLFKRLGIPLYYTIFSINGKKVKYPKEVASFFNQHKGRTVIYGITAEKKKWPFTFYLR